MMYVYLMYWVLGRIRDVEYGHAQYMLYKL